MMRYYLSILFIALLTGCLSKPSGAEPETEDALTNVSSKATLTSPQPLVQINASATNEPPKGFAWLATANAANDATDAIANGDTKLLTIAGRGLMIVGVPEPFKAQAQAKCGIKYLNGVSDAIAPGTEVWVKQATDYANDYNQRLLVHCLPEAVNKP